jgi:Lon protease-like protein
MKIPLFPLDLVLFPGVPLPLHIFEPRYRQMTAECLAANAPFGIVRARPEGLAVIGCTAQIVRVLHRYPDGRSDILTQGIERFEIEQLIGQRAVGQGAMGPGEDTRTCLQAEVDLLPDTGDQATRSAREECVALHFEALHLLGTGEAGMQFDLDLPVAYLVAASMPAGLDFRQELLAIRSDAARTEMLLRYYRDLLPKLRRSRQVNQSVSTNGHIM